MWVTSGTFLCMHPWLSESHPSPYVPTHGCIWHPLLENKTFHCPCSICRIRNDFLVVGSFCHVESASEIFATSDFGLGLVKKKDRLFTCKYKFYATCLWMTSQDGHADVACKYFGGTLWLACLGNWFRAFVLAGQFAPVNWVWVQGGQLTPCRCHYFLLEIYENSLQTMPWEERLGRWFRGSVLAGQFAPVN